MDNISSFVKSLVTQILYSLEILRWLFWKNNKKAGADTKLYHMIIWTAKIIKSNTSEKSTYPPTIKPNDIDYEVNQLPEILQLLLSKFISSKFTASFNWSIYSPSIKTMVYVSIYTIWYWSRSWQIVRPKMVLGSLVQT